MSSTFSLTPEDFRLLHRAAALRFRARHGRFGIPFLLQVLALLCVTLATSMFLRLWRQDPDVARPFGVPGLLLLLALLVLLFLPLASQWNFHRHAAPLRRAFFAQRTVELSAKGLVVTSVIGQSDLGWTSFIDRVEDHRNHYLFIESDLVVVVPKTVAAALGEAFSEGLLAIKCVN